ncbi:hypothetical protein ACFW2V_41795 [Streptomyces sp. NPDC058947]|uniref:hypothetical protein n=1 Tax=Streptomyces TaxID=1883 RepID=UPI00369BC124
MARYASDTGLELDDSDPEDRKILDRQRAAARQAGSDGGDRAGTTRGRADLEQAYDEGAAAKAAPSAPAAAKASKPAAGRAPKLGGLGKAVPTPTLTPPKKVKAADMGGFAFGLVLYALVVSYIRYGSKGPTGWLKAKFLNDPIQGEDLERENKGGSRHENPDSVPWEDLTPEERENII